MTAHSTRIGPTEKIIRRFQMWTVDGEIMNALKNLDLPSSELRRCGDGEAAAVLSKATETFVRDNPRAWWLSLKTPFKSVAYDQGNAYEHLEEYLPADENRCWFIAENDGNVLPVFEGTLTSVKRLLEECCFFEYYLVGKNFDWLIIENDHNELIITRIDLPPASLK